MGPVDKTSAEFGFIGPSHLSESPGIILILNLKISIRKRSTKFLEREINKDAYDIKGGAQWAISGVQVVIFKLHHLEA